METGNITTLEKEISEAVEEIFVLRELTETDGTITSRSQGQVFRRLSLDALPKVLLRLKRIEAAKQAQKGGQR